MIYGVERSKVGLTSIRIQDTVRERRERMKREAAGTVGYLVGLLTSTMGYVPGTRYLVNVMSDALPFFHTKTKLSHNKI